LSSSLTILLLLFAGTSVAQNTLTVASAADLATLQPELLALLRKTDPNCTLQFVTASSAVLSQQIENGAPYDVFLSANAVFVEQLAKEGKIDPASVRAYAQGRVGILWKDGKAYPVSELTKDWVRFVALPNPKLAPYGVAAQQALEHARIWQAVRPKVVYGENVRQTLQLFESGNADAVLTSDSLLRGKPGAEALPAGWHQPIVQKAGVVAASPNAAAARKFLELLTGTAGQAVFARYGFSPPPTTP
jgi:molybdate transport system substrate-binding protein